MTYSPYTWSNDSVGNTPITAERLNAMESGISEAHSVVTVAQRLADELGQSQTDLLKFGADVSGTGITPTQSGTTVTSGITGSGSYRSEAIWGAGALTSFKMGRGWYMSAEWDMFLDAGFSSQDSNSWNVLAQLHGPALNGTWYPPPVEINYQNGSYRVSNSGNIPLPDGSTVSLFDEWMPRLWVPNPVGAWHHWKIGIRVAGPGVGKVNVWVDGKHYVKDWTPANGTFYTQSPVNASSTAQHDWVYFKTGLYGGQTSGIAKNVQHRDLRITTHDVNNIKTWRMTATSSVTPITSSTFTSFTDTTGASSTYHVWGDGRSVGDPLIIWLHGDAAFEHKNPDSTYVFGGANGVAAKASARGMILTSVLTPDTSGTATWWEDSARNVQYLTDLLTKFKADYKPSKIYLAGYSGGAQFITEYFVPQKSDLIGTAGGSIVMGGGGKPITPLSPSFTTNFRNGFKMNWTTGALDDAAHSSEGYDALGYAKAGELWYRNAGFQTTTNWVPNATHDLDGQFGTLLDQALSTMV